MFPTIATPSAASPPAGFTLTQAAALVRLKDAYTHSMPYPGEFDWLPPCLVFTPVELNRLTFVQSLVTSGRIIP